MQKSNEPCLRKATVQDIPGLTELSKQAFDTDITVGAPEPGGPPGYDSPEWHLDMLKDGNLHAFLENGIIVGGAVLFEGEKELYVGRIFISPLRFRQGVGQKLMAAIEMQNTHHLPITLDTPTWNARTQAFYKHCGYLETNRDADSVYFRKFGVKELKCKQNIELRPLLKSENELFVQENQIAFDKAAIEEFGPQEESVIPRQDIEASLHKANAEAFRIIVDGIAVGGVIVVIDPETNMNSLDILYINPDSHSHGIGQKVWQMIEEKYPNTKVWETHTPYFEKRNIHFYVNKCGFHIVEFYNPHHPEPHGPCDTPGGEYFFRFEKVMK